MKQRVNKILLCSPLNVQGGITQWTKHIKRYYESIMDESIELDFFAMDRSKYILNINSIVRRVIWGIKDYTKIINELMYRVKTGDYSIVHIASSASISLMKDLYILWMLKRKEIKTIIHFHFGRIPQLYEMQNWEWKLLKKVVGISTAVIVIDKYSYEVLIKEGFTNVYFLPNPLSPQVEDLVKGKFTMREKRKILFAGHVIKTKGIFELVNACVDIPDIELKLVGKVLPENKRKLEKCWEKGRGKLVITDNIPFENVIMEMLSCSVFVLPTYTEGFPNVILESMCCACPIITTPVGAIPEMLNFYGDLKCGICIAPRTIEPLREAIVKLLDNEEMAKEYGENAKNRVLECYSMDVVWSQLMLIWKKLLTNS